MGEELSVRSFGRWEHTECDECGSEFQVTRTEEKEAHGKVICGDCEMYALGYKDAIHVAPEGYALVPITPTEHMQHKGRCAKMRYGDPKRIYEEMIKAAQESK